MTATEMNRMALALESPGDLAASRPVGVLVASRNMDTRLEVAHHLQGLGYDVWTASSGADAYEVGVRHPTDIGALVCDAGLSNPVTSELFDRLKARHPGLRCCVLSKENGRNRAAEAKCLGAIVVDVGE